MKIRIIREAVDLDVLEEAKEDDIVAKYWYKLSNEFGRDNVLIISIDKDYKQLPALIYNYHYKHRCIYDISEKQALYNFYEQMICGDSADLNIFEEIDLSSVDFFIACTNDDKLNLLTAMYFESVPGIQTLVILKNNKYKLSHINKIYTTVP